MKNRAPGTVIIKRDLHLVFTDDNNQEHVEVLKNVDENIDPEVVQQIMEAKVFFERSKRSGERKCAKVCYAKVVEKITTIIFDKRHDLPRKKATVGDQTTPKPKPAPKEHPIKTEVSLGEMTRIRPHEIAKRMLNNIEVNGLSMETIESYMSDAIMTQLVNGVLPEKRQIEATLFHDMIAIFYNASKWPPIFVDYLPNCRCFFGPVEWLELMKKYQDIGREATALLFGEGTFANYELADRHMKEMLVEAQADYQEYEKQKAYHQTNLAKINQLVS